MIINTAPDKYFPQGCSLIAKCGERLMILEPNISGNTMSFRSKDSDIENDLPSGFYLPEGQWKKISD